MRGASVGACDFRASRGVRKACWESLSLTHAFIGPVVVSHPDAPVAGPISATGRRADKRRHT